MYNVGAMYSNLGNVVLSFVGVLELLITQAVSKKGGWVRGYEKDDSEEQLRGNDFKRFLISEMIILMLNVET